MATIDELVKSPSQTIHRISLLLWGTAGCGKTTLAATAPGKKLWIQFDPDGTTVLGGRDDILLMDLSSEPDRVILKFKEPSFFGLNKYLIEHPEIETVVFDSVTSFAEKTLTVAVEEARNTPKGRMATLEDPGYSGYGNKNTWIRLAIRKLLQVTGELNRHVIIISHEDKPTTDDKGVVQFISMMLGSSLNQQVPIHLSEIWYMSDKNGRRVISVRPFGLYRPMKTRMFLTSDVSKAQFPWTYNAETGKGEGIVDWYNAWKDNGFSKIPLPKP